MLNPLGTVQGGILTAMLDDTMGPAAAHRGGEAFDQTLELETSFLRPARPGPLYGEGRVVATATATARVIPFPAPGGAG